jgi:hypothetical protein
MTDEPLEEILNYFESHRLDLNAYWEDPGVSALIDGVLRAKVRSLVYYLKKLGLDGLAGELGTLDLSEVGIVEFFETVRGHIVPEVRAAQQPASSAFTRPNQAVMADIEDQKRLMIAVATGGPRINEVNDGYVRRRDLLATDLAERHLDDPNPFSDLWKWYGKWSAEIKGYQARREFIVDLYEGLLQALRAASQSSRESEPTGWARVDRSGHKIRLQLARAKDEEDFQAVGLLCREVLISLAQEVFDRTRHATTDGVVSSDTDAGRMLEAFLSAELPGSDNEAVRRHAKAALALANAMTHKRTAHFRAAALCAEATLSVISIVAIISGKRDRAG